jgi:hypothetical protein
MIADFNSDHWPIVYVKFNNNELNDESFEEYKKYYLKEIFYIIIYYGKY